MKKILVYILILSLVPQAAGFPQYASQDVTIPMELLHLSYNIGDDTGVVTEMIVFRNDGATNYSSDLCTILPADAQIMYLQKMDMTNATPTQIMYDLEGGVLRWNASIEPNATPIYSVMYAVPINTIGTAKSGEFVKNIDPAVVNYPIGKFVLRVYTDASIEFTDETRNAIESDETSTEGDGSVLYTWSGPVFKELHIELSQPANMSKSSSRDKWIVYGLIALLIISALLYPILHVRNTKMREKERGAEKGGNKHTSRDRDDENDEEQKEGEWEEINSIVTEVTQTEKDLMRKKKAILAVLNKLEADRDAGVISDADHKRLSSKYEKQAIEIMKQLDRM
ncbi:MAG: hypothetical protein U9N07_04640 [Euryarchaeota archaeon]|nr:hypothetical protein [Euryarchaeota archaeon]